MNKSKDAFKTISEVAELLNLEPHVLRFWESKFRQIQPIKRPRGRRLYRPEDVALLEVIRRLLHDERVTIKGVQKILREQGADAVREGRVALAGASDGDGVGVGGKEVGVVSENIAPHSTLLKARERLLQARDMLAGLGKE